MPITGQDLIINRANLTDAEVVSTRFPDTPPAGHVLLRIDHFALTANTITYGTATDSLGYWSFFPADKAGFGRIPAWGFADVVASAVPEVAPGARLYGFVPMSTHLMVQPGKFRADGFADMAAHRQPMSKMYNRYRLTSADPSYSPETEAQIALFRPLYMTAFLLADFLSRNAGFGAEQVVMSSASSKTALALAAELKRIGTAPLRVAGLTSAGNAAFVSGLGLYDQVVPYENIADLPQAPAVYVDFSGNGDLTLAVHRHLGAGLRHSAQVGVTDWQNANLRVPGLPGPKPVFFFAPAYALERVADWGHAGYEARLAQAWTAFMDQIGWLRVVWHTGSDAARARYLTALSGAFDPAQGDMMSMWDN